MDKKTIIIEFDKACKKYYSFLENHDNSIYDEGIYCLNLMEILFSTFIFILNKEQIKTEKEQKDSYINEEILEQLINYIARKENGYYVIGSVVFKTKEEVLKVIRDKIAHGDFTIDAKAEKLLLNYKDGIIEISREAFTNFVVKLVMNKKVYSNSKDFHRFQVIFDQFEFEQMSKIQDIDKMLDMVNVADFHFFKEPYLTPAEKQYIEALLTNIKNGSIQDLSLINKSYFDRFLQPKGIQSTVSIKSIRNSLFYNSIKDLIINRFEEFKQYNPIEQVSILASWVSKTPNYVERDIITQGMFYNIHILQQMRKSQKSYHKIVEDLESATIATSHLERVVTTLLVNFYATYQYPLEDICKRKDNVSKEEEYFDYKNLSFSDLHPQTFVFPATMIHAFEESMNGSLGRLTKIDSDRERFESSYQKITRIISLEPEREEALTPNLAELQKQINIKLLEHDVESLRYDEYRKLYEAFKNGGKEDLYYYNRFMIEYIRNSISHGKVYFRYIDSNQTFEQSKLRFVNRTDGVTGDIVFDLSVTAPEFQTLLSNENTSKLIAYIQGGEDIVDVKKY